MECQGEKRMPGYGGGPVQEESTIVRVNIRGKGEKCQEIMQSGSRV